MKQCTNNEELLENINEEILKHQMDYEKNEIEKIKKVFEEIINVKTENANSIGDKFISLVGSDHMAVYYLKSIWIIELLIKILENSKGNKTRTIFCVAVLGDLYYFGLDDLDELSIEEYEIEEKKIKQKLSLYTGKIGKELIKKCEDKEETLDLKLKRKENQNQLIESEEFLLRKSKKPIEQTYDSIRNWLLPLLRKDDKILFPKEEFLERMKLFDEAEKLRTFNVIKSAVEYDGYCVKFEEGKIIEGYEVIKAFGEMLGIAVEEETGEKVEEKEEEKKLTPQQLRKKYFLKRMKNSE